MPTPNFLCRGKRRKAGTQVPAFPHARDCSNTRRHNTTAAKPLRKAIKTLPAADRPTTMSTATNIRDPTAATVNTTARSLSTRLGRDGVAFGAFAAPCSRNHLWVDDRATIALDRLIGAEGLNGNLAAYVH